MINCTKSCAFLTLVLCSISVLCGCSSTFPDYPRASIQECPWKATNPPVVVAVSPLTNGDEIKTYFGTNLLARDILPVLVVVENREGTSSIVVDRSKIELLGGEAGTQSMQSSGGRTGEIVATAGAVALVTGPLAAAPVGVLIGGKMASDAQRVQQNMMTKRLDRHTVSPGGEVHGFVYFDISRYDGDYPKAATIRTELLDLRSRETHSVDVTFPWRQ